MQTNTSTLTYLYAFVRKETRKVASEALEHEDVSYDTLIVTEQKTTNCGKQGDGKAEQDQRMT
jgi:hypothetical protein